jgi:hypothetical protein
MPIVRLTKPSSVNLERHLPRPGQRTWSARNKAAVVIAIRSGTLDRVDAYERYMLSEEELSGWEEAFDQDGLAGLLAQTLMRRARWFHQDRPL